MRKLCRAWSKRQELRRLDHDIHDPDTARQAEQLDQDLVRAHTAAQELTAADLRVQQAGTVRKSLEDRVNLRARLKASIATA